MRVRHATDEDLDRGEPLLIELRQMPQLRERKRGSFSRGARAFLHFTRTATTSTSTFGLGASSSE